MGIYLLDVFGNEVLLHAEAPGLLRPHAAGPAAAAARHPAAHATSRSDEGLLLRGTTSTRARTWRGCRAGTVKWLRVVESPEKRFWTQAGLGRRHRAAGPGHELARLQQQAHPRHRAGRGGRRRRTSPCRPTRFVYFQLLDEDGMMVQSMRSGTIVQPGETAGCIGCHESRALGARCRAEPARLAGVRPPPPRALVRPAAPLQLHGRGPAGLRPSTASPATTTANRPGKKLNLAGDLEPGLQHLVHRAPAARASSAWSAPGRPRSSRPRPGAPASRLVAGAPGGPRRPRDRPPGPARRRRLRPHRHLDRHQRAVLSRPTPAPIPDNLYGRSPLDDGRLRRLGELTGADLFQRDRCADVSFTRPETSACLDPAIGGDSVRHGEALAIIRWGAEALAARPREDMPGHDLSGAEDLRREAKYRQRLEDERAIREAMARGLDRWPGGVLAEQR